MTMSEVVSDEKNLYRAPTSKSLQGGRVAIEPAVDEYEDSKGSDKLDQAALEAILAEDGIPEEEYQRVKRKTDWILLPLMWWMYGIQQTDKTGLATMNLFGLQKDTGMHGEQYSLLTVMFYVAYAIFEFPSNYLLQRLNMGKCLAVYMFVWGIIVLVQAFFTNWAEFMAFRFLQGALECTISPGFNIIISRWYITREHSSRSLVFQSANAGWGIIVDAVFYAIAKSANAQVGGFAAWRGIEIFLGGQTLIAAVLAWFLLGTPGEVRWLNKREKTVALARVMRNKVGSDLTGKKHWSWEQTREAFVDPVLYFQFVNTFLACIVNGALTTFNTVLVQSFGFDQYQVVLYDMPRNAFSVAWFVLVGWTSLKYDGIRMWWMLISTVIVFIAMLLLGFLPVEDSYKWPKLVIYWLTAIFVIPSFSAWTLISSNTGGRTKLSVMSAMTFISYCTGNIAGSQIMRPKDAPHYVPGVITMAVAMGAQALVIIAWRVWLVRQNKKKAKEVEAMNITPEEAERRGQEMGARDVTDIQNPFFKYSL